MTLGDVKPYKTKLEYTLLDHQGKRCLCWSDQVDARVYT